MGASDQRKYEEFLSEISNRYVEAGLDPAHLFERVNELHFFLEKNRGPQGRNSIPQIEAIIESKKAEERELDRKIAELRSQKAELEKSNSELGLEKVKIESDLGWDSEIQRSLIQHGFRNGEVAKFIQAANFMRERGYNISEIVEYFARFEELRAACSKLQLSNNEASMEFEQKNLQMRQLEELLKIHSQTISNLRYLEGIGFQLSEFKQLRYLIEEIAEQQDGYLSGNEAVKKFFEDLRNHYFDYVWLKRRVDELKAERTKLSNTDALTLLREVYSGFMPVSSQQSRPVVVNDMKSSGEQTPHHHEVERKDSQGLHASTRKDAELFLAREGTSNRRDSPFGRENGSNIISRETEAEAKLLRCGPSSHNEKRRCEDLQERQESNLSSPTSKRHQEISASSAAKAVEEGEASEAMEKWNILDFFGRKYQQVGFIWPPEESTTEETTKVINRRDLSPPLIRTASMRKKRIKNNTILINSYAHEVSNTESRSATEGRNISPNGCNQVKHYFIEKNDTLAPLGRVQPATDIVEASLYESIHFGKLVDVLMQHGYSESQVDALLGADQT
jgi:hypothetical protein